MSLRGRYLIDRIKRSVDSYLRLPCPPYGNPSYWEGCYRSLGPSDVFEWGNLTLEDLNRYTYRQIQYDDHDQTFKAEERINSQTTTTLGETLGVNPLAPSDEPILMLGCGNSKLGEDMIEAGWRGPLLQVDVASRVIDSMSQRCAAQQQTGDIQLIQDDATVLSAFDDNHVPAAIDKGLVDALFCANEYQQCYNVMKSVHRVLKPNGVFCCLSFSRPEFLLEKLLLSKNQKNVTQWQDVQIRQLDSILLYRFQKADKTIIRKSKHRRRR